MALVVFIAVVLVGLVVLHRLLGELQRDFRMAVDQTWRFPFFGRLLFYLGNIGTCFVAALYGRSALLLCTTVQAYLADALLSFLVPRMKSPVVDHGVRFFCVAKLILHNWNCGHVVLLLVPCDVYSCGWLKI